MKILNNQTGFSALDTVLGVVLVAAIGAAGWFAYQNMHNNGQGSSTASVSPLPHATPTPSQDPTAGWKTYSSDFQKASFKYPSTWTLKQEQGIDPSTNDYQVTLTGPHGLNLQYSDEVSGLGGGCAADSKNVVLTKAQPVPAINSPHPVYLAESDSGLGLDVDASIFTRTAPPDLDIGTCALYFQIPSKNHQGVSISFGSRFQLAGAVPPYSAAQLQDVPTAELILESFRY